MTIPICSSCNSIYDCLYASKQRQEDVNDIYDLLPSEQELNICTCNKIKRTSDYLQFLLNHLMQYRLGENLKILLLEDTKADLEIVCVVIGKKKAQIVLDYVFNSNNNSFAKILNLLFIYYHYVYQNHLNYVIIIQYLLKYQKKDGKLKKHILLKNFYHNKNKIKYKILL